MVYIVILSPPYNHSFMTFIIFSVCNICLISLIIEKSIINIMLFPLTCAISSLVNEFHRNNIKV